MQRLGLPVATERRLYPGEDETTAFIYVTSFVRSKCYMFVDLTHSKFVSNGHLQFFRESDEVTSVQGKEHIYGVQKVLGRGVLALGTERSL